MTSARILLLTKYSSSAASSRYRAYQYIEVMEQAGFRPVVAPLFPDNYLQDKFTSSSRLSWLRSQAVPVARCLGERWWLLLTEISKYDVIYLQYESLPYLPLFFEEPLFRTSARVVVDYDDAINLNYESNRVLRCMFQGKIPGIVRRSTCVIAANKNLARWVSQFNSNLTIIPTSVDLRRYSWSTSFPRHGGKPVIGWIGTPNTAPFLRMLEHPLRMLRAQHDFTFKVIGAPDFTMEGIETVSVPWSEATEVEELRTLDIGVMPIPDDQWGHGKSGLKLIQYLAAGVPAVGSAIGANCDILANGRSGILASSEAEWVDALGLLLVDEKERARLVRAGRSRVEEEFSLQQNGPRFVDVLRQAADS